MSTSLIGALRIVLGIDSASFNQGLSMAEKKLAGFSKGMTKIGKGMQSLGKDMSTYVTAPILGFGALTLKTAGDFEASMNRVGAATGAVGKEFTDLESLARSLGKSTSKSATESADMLEMLAKNGLNSDQILGGAAEAAIKLSEATGGDLSRSADVATNVMAQFGKEAKDLKPIVDQITGVTLASQFGFDDYALALGQAGGVAGALGVSLTDFNAAIAATSDVFNSGSDAGTSFKTFLTRLVPASNEAAATMEKLGLKFFDADGNMKSMAAIAENLKTSLAGLSDEAKNDALQTIFGQDAMRTAASLGNEGASGINAITEAINKKGLADEQAAARMKGFNGEMEKLGGAFTDLQIAIGKSGFLQMMTDMVSTFAKWVSALAESNPEFVKWGAVIAGVLAVGGPLLIGLGLLAAGLAAISWPAVLVAGAIALVTAAVIKFWPEIKMLGELMGRFLAQEWEKFKTAMANGKDMFNNIASAIGSFLSDSWAKFESAWDGMVTKVHNVKDELFKFASEIPGMFADLAGKMLEIGGQIMDGLWEGIKGKFAAIKDGIVGFGNDLVGGFKGILGIQSPSKVMHAIGQNIMDGLGLGMASKMGDVNAVAAGAAGSITGTFKQLEASASATGTKINDAWAGMREVTAEAKQAGGAMDGIFSDAGSSIAELIKGTKSWRDVLADVLGKISDMALQNLGSMGGFGGFLSSLLGGLTGFANGGSIMPGGTGGIDSQVVAFRKSPNERVDITKPGQRVGGGMSEVMVRGVFVDDNGVIKAQITQMGRQAAEAGHRGAVRETRQSFEGWQAQLARDGRLV